MRDLAISYLPDLPRWVETRSLLLSGRCSVSPGRRAEAGYLVCGTAVPLVCMVGRPEPEVIRKALAQWTLDHRVIAPLEAAGHLSAALPDWRVSTATLHLPGPAAPAFVKEDYPDVRLLESGDGEVLGRLPDVLREEIARALPGSAVAVALVEGEPASVCYACWETETLWDLSIDTVDRFRRRGLAERCSAYLIAHMARQGKQAVWGAEDHNAASLRLAAKLGFVPVDRLVVLAPPGTEG